MSSLFSFLVRTFWPLLAFVLLLSIGLNAFFLTVDRFRASKEHTKIIAPVSTTGAVLQELERGPKAFGVVHRGFSVTTQVLPKGITLPSVTTYDISLDAIPALPAMMTLYRDQGVDLDTTLLQTVFQKLGAPYNVSSLQFFTKAMSFRSSDRSLEISIDVEKRFLSIKQNRAAPVATSTSKADDAECIALAKDFVATMGFGHFIIGEPRVVDRSDPVSGTKTFVLWDAMIDGYPLVDLTLQPVPKIEVQVGRISKRAILLNVNLLETGLLARSAYPTATPDLTGPRLLSGGFLPLPAGPKGKGASVAYTDLVPAYLLYSSNQTEPTYLLPIIKASWSMKPSCAGCVPQKFSTFVPALHPGMFLWETEKLPKALPLSSAASSQSSPQ